MKREELQVFEHELPKEKGNGLSILVCIESGRKEWEWPAPQLKQLLPEANIQAPSLPVFGQKASDVVNEILRNHPNINIVVTGTFDTCFKPDLSSFNICSVKPQYPLSELGRYVCREATELNICWRKDGDTSLRNRVENVLRVYTKKILDERIEQYHHEGGEYEDVANTAVDLFSKLSSKYPQTGWLERNIEETASVRIQKEDFKLVVTISPGNKEYISLYIVLKHPMIRDHNCLIDGGTIKGLTNMIVSRDGMYKMYSSIQSLMMGWPTPLEIKFSKAALIDADEFYATPKEESQIVKLHKDCVLHIMGHTFHGIKDVMSWKGKEPVILEKYKMFPCFDSYDYASENRFYHNYLFCKDANDASEKKDVYEAIPKCYGCVIGRNYPEHLRPLLYYGDESNIMILFF